MPGLFGGYFGGGVVESKISDGLEVVAEFLSVIYFLEADDAGIVVSEGAFEPVESLFPGDFRGFRAALEIVCVMDGVQ